MTAGAAGALMAAFWAASDGSSCAQEGSNACLGQTVVVVVFALPVALVAARFALRTGGARSPLLGLVAICGALYVLVVLSEAVEPPLLVWPFVVGVLAYAYLILEPRLIAA